MVGKKNDIHVAPCGIDCSLCMAFQREKNKCDGCNCAGGSKVKHLAACRIRNCEELAAGGTGFCYSCEKLPCKRMKQLDKRYSTKYGTSPIQNLRAIEKLGIEKFARAETRKWKCGKCGALVCMHRPECLSCGSVNENFPLNKGKEE